MLSSPAWANLQGIDIVRLIGTGMCFGGAIVSIATYFRNDRTSWLVLIFVLHVSEYKRESLQIYLALN